MSNSVTILVALALIAACAGFALFTAASHDSVQKEREPTPEPPVPEPAPVAGKVTPRRDARRARRAARRAVLAERAATRRAERAAYAAKRASERAARRARPLAELDPFAPVLETDLPVSPNGAGGGAGQAVPTGDGLGPAVAFWVPRPDRDDISSLGPAVGTVEPKPAPEAVPAATAAHPAVVAATRPRPRIFTGEPVELEPREHPTRRAVKLLGGMTALATVGAIGLLALVRAIAAMFGR